MQPLFLSLAYLGLRWFQSFCLCPLVILSSLLSELDEAKQFFNCQAVTDPVTRLGLVTSCELPQAGTSFLVLASAHLG